jgi:hypothetical protein
MFEFILLFDSEGGKLFQYPVLVHWSSEQLNIAKETWPDPLYWNCESGSK